MLIEKFNFRIQWCLINVILSLFLINLAYAEVRTEENLDDIVQLIPGSADTYAWQAKGDHLYVVWEDSQNNHEIFFRHSSNNGQDWGTTLNISNNAQHALLSKSTQSSMAIIGDSIFLIWMTYNDWFGIDQGEIYFRRSMDNGQTFEPAIKMSETAGSWPQLATNGETLYSTWLQNGKVMVKRSVDKGVSFESTQVITADFSNEYQIVANNKQLYLIGGITTPMFIRSDDQAQTFEQALTFSGSFTAEKPTITVEGNFIYLLWATGDGRFYYAHSEDSGKSFDNPPQILATETGGVSGKPKITFSKSGSQTIVFVSWAWGEHLAPETGIVPLFDAGKTKILVRRSIDNGKTFEATQVLAESEAGRVLLRPDISMRGNRVYAVWQDYLKLSQRTEKQKNYKDDKRWTIRSATSIDMGGNFGGSPNFTKEDNDQFSPRANTVSHSLYTSWQTDTNVLLRRLKEPLNLSITANNSEDEISISTVQNVLSNTLELNNILNMVVEISPQVGTPICQIFNRCEQNRRDTNDLSADWWILAETSTGSWYHFDASSQKWLPGVKVTYQKPVGDADKFEIANTRNLPKGRYTLYFGVDGNVNGSIDFPMHYNTVTINIL